MTGEAGNILPKAAEAMLDAFTSVGANRFVVTWRTLQDEEIQVRKHWSVGYIRRNLPALLAEAERRQLNLIIRPGSPRGFLLQLDDLSPEMMERVRPVALLTLATSPKKTQAWLFVEGHEDPDADRDFRRRVKKACAADLMASGAVRLAGSLNFKPKYAPNFPCIAITHALPGLMTTRERLQQLGLVAAPDTVPAARRVPLIVQESRGWPDYQQCLDGAPQNSDGSGRDRSRADFLWCKWAIERGRSVEETAARLMELTAKAQEARHGKPYALGTAQRAAAAAVRGRHERAEN
jgi:hypothetical protein